MNPATLSRPKARPKYYDLNLLNLPAPGLLSILHRLSGAAMFLLLIPLLLFIMQQTLKSEAGFMQWKVLLTHPLAKLVLLGFVWAYAHHFFAGIRYLLLDLHIGVAKAPSQQSARVVIGLGLVTTLIAGWFLW